MRWYPRKNGSRAEEKARITSDGRYFVDAPSLGYFLDKNPKYTVEIDCYQGGTINLTKRKVKGDEPPVRETMNVVSRELLQGYDTADQERLKGYKRAKHGL